jgi:hypothetical protein
MTDSMFIAGGTAYDLKRFIALCRGKDTAMQPKTPSALWTVKLPSETRSMVLAGDVLLLAGGADLVACQAKQDGKELGRLALPKTIIRNGLAVAAGHIYAATEDGSVLLLNR